MTTTPDRDWREQYAATLREFRTFDEHVDAVMAIDQAHAAEVRAAALGAAGFAVQQAGRNCSHDAENGCDFCNGIDTALEQIRRMAAAARPDNTTGA